MVVTSHVGQANMGQSASKAPLLACPAGPNVLKSASSIPNIAIIEVPVEIRNRRTKVIFLVVDGVTESPNADPDGMDLTADQFFGALPDCRHRSRQWNDSGD